MDWPEDVNTHSIDDAWMIGDRLLAAPLTAGENGRSIYLPAGEWYDFWNGEWLEGGRGHTLQARVDTIPLFVHGGGLLPLARPTLHTADPRSLELEVRVYGDGRADCELVEDDGVSEAYRQGLFNRVALHWESHKRQGTLTRSGDYTGPGYRVTDWKIMEAK
jgi:alpha-D-xyloside xylohydrolase